MRPNIVELIALRDLPMFGPSSDVAGEIEAALARSGTLLADGDIVVVAQKIVSKAEGRTVCLGDIEPGARARSLAEVTGKDPRILEIVLSESKSVLRAKENVIVVEHRLGHIMANAGIDQSNVEGGEEDGIVLLLPLDPDASAEALRQRLDPGGTVRIGVIISDSFGRPWRKGTTGVAIGVAGIPAVVDRRGDPDLFGRALQVTEVAFADAVASAAVMVMGEGAEGCPVAIVRGMDWKPSRQRARDLLRDSETNMFR